MELPDGDCRNVGTMNANVKKLIQILSDGFFHSGTELGEKLGLTRGGIWKLVQQMEALGILVESKTNKGYQIVDGLELLSLEKINSALSPSVRSLIQEIILLDEISSTNDFLLKHPPIPVGKAVVCLAESQTAGRGRFGRKWIAPYGCNLYLSLLWYFPMDAGQLSGLSLVIALSVVRALNRYGIEMHLHVKWPNDVLWRGKKLAGCLIETRGEANDACHTVIGIGLNLNMPLMSGRDIEREWTDIRQIIHNLPERNRLAGFLLDTILQALPVFQAHGLTPFRKAWDELDISLNRVVSVVTATEAIQGIYRGIDARGCLLLQDERDDSMRVFSSGEVSLQFKN